MHRHREVAQSHGAKAPLKFLSGPAKTAGNGAIWPNFALWHKRHFGAAIVPAAAE
jgi:hypothetical protein